MNVGVVGSGSDKFTESQKARVIELLQEILAHPYVRLVSGHSPVGGVDIWSEEVADAFGVPKTIYVPEIQQWNPPGRYGYKARNLDIAKNSDVLHVIVVKDYPPDYKGMRFEECYHCLRMARDAHHCKSGGCYTGEMALKMGKEVIWHIIE